MKPATVTTKALVGLVQLLVILAALLFLSAGSLRYWQGWLLWIVFAAAAIPISIYFIKKDPALIERRLKAGPRAEKETTQKVIQVLASIFFGTLIIVPGLDHRFGWSHLPVYVVFTGDALVIVGLLIVFFVFKENSYASAVIEVDKGQAVISTGPYRLVRHPLYAGDLLFLFGVPLALGSLWGLLLWLPTTAIIVLRLINEERYLSENLAGYAEYRSKTRYRLLPGIY